MQPPKKTNNTYTIYHLLVAKSLKYSAELKLVKNALDHCISKYPIKRNTQSTNSYKECPMYKRKRAV